MTSLKSIFVGIFIVTACVVAPSGVAQEVSLNREAQRDELQSDIGKAAGHKQYQKVLKLIDTYRRQGFTPVTGFYYTEAVAAYYTGDMQRASNAAANYLNSPDNQAFHDEAAELHRVIKEQNERRLEQEMAIHWTGSVTKPTILRGHATVDGHSLNIIGMTLQCELWNPNYHSPTFSSLFENLVEENQAYFAGKNLSPRAWHRDSLLMTLNVLDPAIGNPRFELRTSTVARLVSMVYRRRRQVERPSSHRSKDRCSRKLRLALWAREDPWVLVFEPKPSLVGGVPNGQREIQSRLGSAECNRRVPTLL
jgi:hypothetical protein